MPGRSRVPSSGPMSDPSPRLPRYLAEWYRPELTAEELRRTAARLEEGAAELRDEGAAVRLLMTLAVPIDEVIFGVFAAGSKQSVCEACRRAGIPAGRLSGAMDALVPLTAHGGPTRPPSVECR